MPLLKIAESKKITIYATIEETTAKQIDQYAAWTKGNSDEVIQQALDYVFGKDKEFERFRTENPAAKPKIPLRVKRSASTATTSADAAASTAPSTAARSNGVR